MAARRLYYDPAKPTEFSTMKNLGTAVRKKKKKNFDDIKTGQRSMIFTSFTDRSGSVSHATPIR